MRSRWCCEEGIGRCGRGERWFVDDLWKGVAGGVDRVEA